MADTRCLEGMGRELKCPICLSLLKSTVSLPCNHLFCYSCILSSMKTRSDCPICNVPYRRREIRVAPQMDNLVAIYKEMEHASGISIFTTQHPSLSEKSADNKRQEAKQKSKSKEKSKSRSKNEHKLSDVQRQPSFPTNKRVQVTLDSLSQIPVISERIFLEDSEAKPVGISEKGRYKDCLARTDEISASEKQEDPIFSPFFWLKEVDSSDDATCYSRDTATTGGGPSDVPAHPASFSDVLASQGHESMSQKMKVELDSASRKREACDDLFAWTQIACSPELCSTPTKPQRHRRMKNTTKFSTRRRQFRQKGMKQLIGQTSVAEDCYAKPGSGAAKCPALLKERKVNLNQASKIDKLSPGKKSKECGKQNLSSSQMNGDRTRSYTSCGAEDLKKFFEMSGNVPSHSTKNTIKQMSEEGYNGSGGKRATKSEEQRECGNSNVVIQNNQGRTTRRKLQRHRICDKRTSWRLSSCPKMLHDQELKAKSDRRPGQINNKRKVSGKNFTVQLVKNDAAREPGMDQTLKDENMDGKMLDVPGVGGDHTETSFLRDIDECGELLNFHYEMGNVHASKKQKGVEGKEDIFTCNDDGLAPFDDKENKHAPSIEDKNHTSMSRRPMVEEREVSGKIDCAFCSGAISEDTGVLMHYFGGKSVSAGYNGGLELIHSHQNCTEWAPNVYFEGDRVINLEAEICRSRKIRCSYCGVKGAALGCYNQGCRKSFHVPCAKLIPQCRWDHDNFVMLCPHHSEQKLPCEMSSGIQQNRKKKTVIPVQMQCPPWKWPSGLTQKWLFCSSGLNADEKDDLSKLAKLTGAAVANLWTPSVTHVIASTDEQGACKRTFKFLMAILGGKWVLTVHWVRACLAAMEPVEEEKFEIEIDTHGVSGGSREGRLKAMNNAPKLFNGFTFFLTGEYTPMYKMHLHDLVTAGGGSILRRKPVSRNQERLLDECYSSVLVVVFSTEVTGKHIPERTSLIIRHSKAEAKVIASACNASMVPDSWIFDSIASSKLMRL